MKIIWEEKDILVGTLYIRSGMQEVWMIGYDAAAAGGRWYVSVSMNDGMVTSARTKDDYCNMLNEAGCIPAMLAPGMGIELPHYIKTFILSKMPT